jgi:hypothetical protein
MMIHKITKPLIVVVINLFLLATLSFAVCPNLEGLYQKRKELLKKYEWEMDKNKERAGTYWRQIQTIDQTYRAVIYKLFFEYEQKNPMLFNNCCKGPQNDKYLFFVCKLIAYYLDGNADLFLKDIPVEKGDLEDLWEIDSVTFTKEYDSKPRPKVFEKRSFVVVFLDSIYGLATNGNPKAIDKFLSIKSFADGSMAEYMADNILNLFENHPSIISKNWKVIKKYKSTISFETTDYKSKADCIIRRYQDLFEKNKTDSLVSKEILGFLKEKAK